MTHTFQPFQPLLPVYFPARVQGQVTQTIFPKCRGQVRYQGSYWMARLLNADHQTTIQKGRIVQIMGRVGNTLLVTSE
jgi:membrane protein implicated in regulation of membrane protease activity